MMNSKFENFQVQDIKPQQGLRKDCSCLLWLSKKVEQVHISCPPVAKNNVCLKVVAWQRQKPACTTKVRFEVLKELRRIGIPTVVWLCPILPFINDTEENIKGILNYCSEAEVYGIICFGMGLTLREGSREYFFRQLDHLFPGMKEKYLQAYGMQYQIVSNKNDELMQLFHHTCEKNGIVHDNRKIFEYLSTFETKCDNVQLSLFDKDFAGKSPNGIKKNRCIGD